MLSTAVLFGLAWPTVGASQTKPDAAPEPAKAGKPAAAVGPVDSSPLARYVARDGLVLYAEFAGLDANADAWKKTAAYRMLTSTSLGAMLEEVGAQVLDRVLQNAPNRKLNGAELVTVIEQMMRRGWLLALNADAKGAKPLRATIVLRGAVVKENKPLFGRLVGSFMAADSKAKIERKAGRAMIVVPRAQGAPAGMEWVWWAEKDDLVIGLSQTSDTPIPSILDGQTPSAVDHPLVTELKKRDGGFTPVLTAFVDPAGCPSGTADPLLRQVARLDSQANVKRLDYRWGFEDESLMGVARLVAPQPRKGALAFFGKPATDPKSILPVPDGVEYFASLSLKPEQVTALFSDSLGGGPAQGRFAQLVEDLRSHSRIDLQKDLLAHMGPRIMLYMAPGGASAVVDAEQAEPGAPGALDPSALLKQFGPSLPSPVLAAEVNDPVKFGRALDALMVEVNRALKAQAGELAAQAARAAADAGDGAAPEPGKRRRDNTPAAPEFRLLPGATAASTKIYMLNVPKDSPMKALPNGVKPSIRLEGKHVAFSTSPQAARMAIESLERKAWAPSPELERSLAKTSENTVMFFYGDSRETTPTILASLPGTLQSLVNSFIATAAQAERIAEAGPAASPFQPGGVPGAGGGPGSSGDPGSSAGLSSSSASDSASSSNSGSSSSIASSGSGGSSGGSGSGGLPQGPGSNSPSMIQIRVDPAKLPRADDLKALMFPSTVAVVADDATIQIVSREAFPDLSVVAGMTGVAPAVLMPSMIAASSRAKAAREAAAAKDANAPGGQDQPGAPGAAIGQPGSPQPGQPGGGSPGPGARRRDR